MQLRLLGTVEAQARGRRIVLGPRKQRLVLAVLALEVNRPVSIERLVELAWPIAPPRTAEHAIRVCVSGLRTALAGAGVGAAEAGVRTHGTGYLLRTDALSIDVHRFRALLDEARHAPDDRIRVSILDRALALWSGPPLAGTVPIESYDRLCAGLDEVHRSAVADQIDARLRLGHHHELVADLTTLVAADPLDERRLGQLMLALHRAGRAGEALAAYQVGRRRLAEQLGADPGAELRRLHLAILRDEPALRPAASLMGAPGPGGPAEVAAAAGAGEPVAARPAEVAATAGAGEPVAARPAEVTATAGAGEPAAGRPAEVAATAGAGELAPGRPPAPAQLPAAVAGFTGRAAALAELDALLDAAAGGLAMAIAVIGGSAGVGKTALAVRWALQRRDRFPDGQLYVDLGGYAPGGTPMRPHQALARMLRALGVAPEEIPLDPAEAGAHYRSLLADRRTLIVLDNANTPDQVRPLLPAGPGCLVLVTSRDRLTGLTARDGARPLTLGVLTPGEARALLATLIDADRVAAEPDATAELARLCGYLPLALRIAAANLAGQQRRSVAQQVAELRAGDRLGMLQVDGDEHAAVRASFDLSYAALAPETRRLFRLASLAPGADFTAPAAAALSAADLADTAAALGRLVNAHLLDEPRPGRFAMHDLLRLYARQLADAEDGAERDAAAGRLEAFCLAGVDAAARVLYPQMQRLPLDPRMQRLPLDPRMQRLPLDPQMQRPPPDPRMQRLPLDPQMQRLPLDVATPAEPLDHATALAWLEDERPNLVAVVGAAADAGRPAAWLLTDALRGYFWMRRYADDWLAVGEAALAAAVAAADAPGQAAAHLCLAQANRWLTRHDAAVHHFVEARDRARAAGWPEGEAAAVGSIANLYRDQGRLAESADHHRAALAIFERTGALAGQAVSLGNLGNVLFESGRLDEAIEHLRTSLRVYERIGARNARGHILNSLGCTYHALGRLDDALAHLDQALALHREAGSREGEADTLNNIAQVHCSAGRYAEARRLAQASAAMAAETGDERVEADAHNTMGAVERAGADLAAAVAEHSTALRLARSAGYRQGQADALIGLADARRGLGRRDEARATAEDALAITRRTGYRILEADALAALAGVEMAEGAVDAAKSHAAEALAIYRAGGHRRGEAAVGPLLASLAGPSSGGL
ncbi:tetratricopeptide repeat protein [Actinoplanes sp. KI2]|uniref:AfsR/SARP family transcriptional regulator n=1 Tax=Actinoplanes sp. KI2 TaxID=2983315 RepID=UPI0021D58EC7|nr:AfsR/SARP family transcriptional regulator [Actinoplanes sp. KI2]MCU7727428.1 tetratricopeptide repeat protein [Actinoplanes sp. KI2]